jgi:dTDP-glucose pyrophosphorylase
MINVVIPMNGQGSRFSELGFTVPKPLIDVFGLPMIQRAVWTFGVGGRYIYIVNAEQNKKYNYSELLPEITPALEVIVIEADGPTEGAAETVLLAKEYINTEDPLITCNSDQIVEWDPNEFLVAVGEKNLDGCIPVFTSEDPKWSYVKTNESEIVTETAEKNPISNQATVGFYYWKHGSDYVRYAKRMMEKNIRVNNEFYICPVYNEAIADGKRIGVYQVDKMFGLGTPEDLEEYLKNETNSSQG